MKYREGDLLKLKKKAPAPKERTSAEGVGLKVHDYDAHHNKYMITWVKRLTPSIIEDSFTHFWNDAGVLEDFWELDASGLDIVLRDLE